MPQIDIKIDTQFNGQGFKQLEKAASGAALSIGDFGAKLGVGILGAQTAAKVFENEVRRVIQRIDEIPGVPQETVDSINRAKYAIEEARVGIDRWIARGVTAFTQFGEGLGYMLGQLKYGKEAAVDAFGATQDAATKAAHAEKDAANQAKLFADNQREAAKASDELKKSLAGFSAAYVKEGLVGESLGAKITRLKAESAAKSTAAKGANGKENFDLETEALKLKTEAEELELKVSERAVALGEKQRDAEVSRLAPAAQLAAYASEMLALNAEVARLDINDPAQLIRGLDIEDRRLVVQAAIADAAKREADEKEKAARFVRPTLVQRDQADLKGMSDGTQHYQSAEDGAMGGAIAALTQLGTVGDQVGAGIYASIGGAFNGISTSIQGLFNKTMTFGQALGNVWTSFRGSMVQAFSDMAAKYLASKVVMFAIDTAFAAKGLLLSAANAAKSLIMWIPSAIAASISSWGTAAAIGAAAVGVALIAANNFDVGGYTPGGPKTKAVGTVHAGEWVAPAWMLSNPATAEMIAGLEQARTGGGIPQLTRPDDGSSRSGGSSGGGSPGGSGGGREGDIIFGFHGTVHDTESWLRTQTGRKVMIDFITKNKHELG